MYSSVRPDNDLVVSLQLDIDEFRSVLEGMRFLTNTEVWDYTDGQVYKKLVFVARELQELDLW